MSVMWSRRRRRHANLSAQRVPVVFGATGARIAEMPLIPSGGRTQCIGRHPMVLGRHMRRIRIGFHNVYFGDSGLLVLPPSSITLVGTRIRGGTYSGLLTWFDPAVPTPESSPAPVVAPGGIVETDWLRPADLGLASFSPGQVVWLDLVALLASGSGRFPVGPVYTWNAGVGSTGFFAIYDPVNHIDQLGTSGDMVAPTGALLGSEFGAAGFDSQGATPVGGGDAANNMCVGASYLIGELA